MALSKHTQALPLVRSLRLWWGEAIERMFADHHAVPLEG